MKSDPVGECGCKLIRTEHGLHMQDCPLHAAAPELLAALIEAKKALADILDNHPDVWPTGGKKDAQTPERRAWRTKIEGYRDAARAAIRAAVGGAA